MSLMPGLMMDFPGPGKLKWAANVATAESEARYFGFENAALQTAFALKKSYYELHFLDAKVNVNRETPRLVGEIEKLARTQKRSRQGHFAGCLAGANRAGAHHNRNHLTRRLPESAARAIQGGVGHEG
jgi:outer membrane protein TolC